MPANTIIAGGAEILSEVRSDRLRRPAADPGACRYGRMDRPKAPDLPGILPAGDQIAARRTATLESGVTMPPLDLPGGVILWRDPAETRAGNGRHRRKKAAGTGGFLVVVSVPA